MRESVRYTFRRFSNFKPAKTRTDERRREKINDDIRRNVFNIRTMTYTRNIPLLLVPTRTNIVSTRLQLSKRNCCEEIYEL